MTAESTGLFGMFDTTDTPDMTASANLTEAAVSTDPGELLTPGEVAALFSVTPKTVSRWAEAGRLPVVMTLGGHRRYPAAAVLAIRAELETGVLIDMESGVRM